MGDRCRVRKNELVDNGIVLLWNDKNAWLFVATVTVPMPVLPAVITVIPFKNTRIGMTVATVSSVES